ncbi:MAG: CDP-diacylglycerol--serine O-phosphatidyltransferase [Planctomycetota bacterium]|jgi:CDP-diacylglycerol--serine O-phosphatidyltransferase
MTTPRPEDLPVRRSRKRLRRRLKEVPIWPSLVTLGNLVFGFLAAAKVADALRLSVPGVEFAAVMPYFEIAAVLVFVAMVFDALDGSVARMTGQTSNFGAQLDSLADMVTFGVVPAFIAKVLIDLHAQADVNNLLPIGPKLVYSAAVVYVAGAAMRLARFNVETGVDEEDHAEFKGLPSPAAAAVICSMIAMFCTRGSESAGLGNWLLLPEHYDLIVVSMPAVLVLLGLLMISNVPYPHFVIALAKGRHSMSFLVGAVVVVAIAAVEWQLAMITLTTGYVLWGMALGSYRAVFARGKRDDDLDDDLDDDAGEDRDDADVPGRDLTRSVPSRN